MQDLSGRNPLDRVEGPADPVPWDDHLEDWWDGPAADYGPHPDLHELQGAWIAVAGQRRRASSWRKAASRSASPPAAHLHEAR